MSQPQYFSASEAARALGISIDTLRRWDRSGRIRTERDSANRRIVAAALSCLVFDGPTMRRFNGIDELVSVSATSRIACDWSPTELP